MEVFSKRYEDNLADTKTFDEIVSKVLSTAPITTQYYATFNASGVKGWHLERCWGLLSGWSAKGDEQALKEQRRLNWVHAIES
jgi:hypothetical protein